MEFWAEPCHYCRAMATELPLRRAEPGERRQGPAGDTVEERILSVYRSVRLPGAIAAGLGNLVLTFLFEWPYGWLAVAAAALAAFDSVRELRHPRRSPAGTIFVDATLIGLTMVAAGLPAVSFAFGLWIVLLTAALARGWGRIFLYLYIAVWAVLANLVTWSGEREWTRFEVLVLDWAALLLVGALVIGLLELALRRIRDMEAERNHTMGVVGHELGNALTSLVTASAALERHHGSLDLEDARRLVASIRANAQDAADIADDILTLARLREESLWIKPQPVDPSVITSEVVGRVAEGSDRRVSLVNGGASAMVMVDPLRFRQVLRNLLVNALEHGGHQVEVAVYPQGEQMVVQVKDDGPGPSPETVDAVFGVQGGAPTSSAGLGLWISHRLVTEMGGQLRFWRDPPWSVFEISFPAIPGE